MNGPLIRKITVGPDPKNGLAYVVGKPSYTGGGIVTDIVESVENKIYLVYISSDEAKVLWKKYVDVKITIDYDIEKYA